jgi:hypothetical protein
MPCLAALDDFVKSLVLVPCIYNCEIHVITTLQSYRLLALSPRLA